LVEQIIKFPHEIEIPDTATILDVICKVDQAYYSNREGPESEHETDFLSKDMLSLMQLIWNPETQIFYDDVGVEARTKAPESVRIPIVEDWKIIIPNEAWILLAPDAGC
jgi:hypothetical protein